MITLSVLVTRSAGPSVLVTPGDFYIKISSFVKFSYDNLLLKRKMLKLSVQEYSYIELFFLMWYNIQVQHN